MRRSPRCYHPDGIYHLTAHGIDDRPIYNDDIDRQEFCIRFHRVVRSEGWVIYAACLVDTHYHALVGPTRGRVSHGMRGPERWLLEGVQRSAWQARCALRVALPRLDDSDEHHFANTVRYSEENAVECGLAASVDDWLWTTANENSPLKVPVSDTSSPHSTIA